MDREKLYITVANIGPFVEKVNLKALGITVPPILSYHIVSVDSAHQIKYVIIEVYYRANFCYQSNLCYFCSEEVSSRNVILQPKEAFVLRSQVSVRQKSKLEYFHYSLSDL